jgi:hypothetical protein
MASTALVRTPDEPVDEGGAAFSKTKGGFGLGFEYKGVFTMHKILRLALLLIALSPGAAMAQQWGAVGIGNDGSHAYSNGYSSEQGAYDRMQNECGWRCDHYRTFYASCGAMAMASNGAWGWGQNMSLVAAQSRAMAECAARGNGCQLMAFACSG